jgi:hypothetical protein
MKTRGLGRERAVQRWVMARPSRGLLWPEYAGKEAVPYLGAARSTAQDASVGTGNSLQRKTPKIENTRNQRICVATSSKRSFNTLVASMIGV